MLCCRFRLVICFVVLVLLAAIVPAARAQDSDTQAWGLFTFNARFSDGLRLYAEVQPRQGDDLRHFRQLLVRPAVGYQLNRHASAWIGYAWVPTFIPMYRNEHRVFQQFLYENNVPGYALSNRTRLEERSIQNARELAWRVRHQFRAYHRLDRANKWGLVAYDELFWNLNSTPNGPQSGFDQNRLYFGGSHTFSPHVRAELGYLANHVNTPFGGRDRRFDVLLLTVNYTL